MGKAGEEGFCNTVEDGNIFRDKQTRPGEIIVTQVFDETLPEIIKDNSLVLVDFYADWCQPCKILMPIIEDISSKYKSKVLVGKVNTDHEISLSSEYDIAALPTLILFKNGAEMKRFIGLTTADSISEAIDKYL